MNDTMQKLTEMFERLDVNLKATGLARQRPGTIINVAALVVIVSAVVIFLATVHPGIF